MSGVIHLKDDGYTYPACGQAPEEIILTEQIVQVTCECCKRTSQYLAKRDVAISLVSNEVLAQAVRTSLAKIAGTPLEPTPLQVATFTMCVEITHDAPANHHASVRGEMDEDGTLLVTLIEDEARQMARFGRDGRLLGDWF